MASSIQNDSARRFLAAGCTSLESVVNSDMSISLYQNNITTNSATKKEESIKNNNKNLSSQYLKECAEEQWDCLD